MSKVFNSGMGGVICDKCRKLVVAGHTDRKLHWIYGDDPFYVCQVLEHKWEDRLGEKLHFCSRECIEQYEEKFEAKIRVACVVAPLEINDDDQES